MCFSESYLSQLNRDLNQSCTRKGICIIWYSIKLKMYYLCYLLRYTNLIWFFCKQLDIPVYTFLTSIKNGAEQRNLAVTKKFLS